MTDTTDSLSDDAIVTSQLAARLQDWLDDDRNHAGDPDLFEVDTDVEANRISIGNVGESLVPDLQSIAEEFREQTSEAGGVSLQYDFEYDGDSLEATFENVGFRHAGVDTDTGTPPDERLAEVMREDADAFDPKVLPLGDNAPAEAVGRVRVHGPAHTVLDLNNLALYLNENARHRHVIEHAGTDTADVWLLDG